VKDFLIKIFDKVVNEHSIKYFIEFGLIEGLIYRMHRYAMIKNPTHKANIRSKADQFKS